MTQRLLSIASSHWARIDGALAASLTTDPLDLPIDRFLNLVYWRAVDGGSEEDVRKFESRLWMPPVGVAPAPQSPWSPENETRAFKGLVAEVGSKAREGAPVTTTE